MATALGAISTTSSVPVTSGGLVPTADLGSGTANNTSFLRGDQTWAVLVREELVAMWDEPQTKTNIGSAFVDIFTATNSDGHSVTIDTTGKTQVKLQVLWNKIGAGTQTVQVLEVGTANVLISMDVVSGSNVSSLTTIPAFAQNAVKVYKLQGKSTTAGDDPVFEGARIWLK